jgi:hypothetical protein
LDDSVDDEDGEIDDDANYLKLMQRLNPLRMACGVGRTPLDGSLGDEDSEDHEMNVDVKSERERPKSMNGRKLVKHDRDVDQSEVDVAKKKKVRKPIEYSEFAFTKKLRTLVEELKRVEAEEPLGK